MSMQLHLTMKKGKMPLRGEDYLWSLIMETGKTFTIADIRRMSSASEPTIREFVKRLIAGGFVECIPTIPVVRYRVAKPQAETPRVRKDGSIIESAGAAQCMWNAMRTAFRTGFNALDLVSFASTDEVDVTLPVAQTYIKKLNAAGYLLVIKRRSAAYTVWRLDPAMNTGPKAPMILKTQLVYDPNKGDIIGAAEAEEVLA